MTQTPPSDTPQRSAAVVLTLVRSNVQQAPELGALLEIVRFIHEADPALFAVLANITTKLAAERGAPIRPVQVLQRYKREGKVRSYEDHDHD